MGRDPEGEVVTWGELSAMAVLIVERTEAKTPDIALLIARSTELSITVCSSLACSVAVTPAVPPVGLD